MSKQDRIQKSVFWRWYFLGQAGWNYNKMQGLGYYYSIFPFLENQYHDKNEMKEMAEAEIQFFNTNAGMTPLILGVDMAVQEEKGIEAKETAAALKTGLMGPLAGIGDTLFGVLPSTIIGSIASYMALEGNPAALLLWIVFGFVRLFLMRSFYKIGYTEGSKAITELGDRLKRITSSANILGVTVIGGLIPTVVNAQFDYEFVMGEVTITLQELSDQIMPGLAPALVVLLTYWLLGNKKMNSTRVTLLLIIAGILFNVLNILA